MVVSAQSLIAVADFRWVCLSADKDTYHDSRVQTR